MTLQDWARLAYQAVVCVSLGVVIALSLRQSMACRRNANELRRRRNG